MPPTTEEATLVADHVDYEDEIAIDIFAAMHLCPNEKCTGGVVAYYKHQGTSTGWYYDYLFHQPRRMEHRVPDEVPERARKILQAANDARSAPIACVTTAVRAVEAMIAEVGYSDRSMVLKRRISTAVADGKLPEGMADWANEVREFGNESHTDQDPAELATPDDAKHVLGYANTLAEYLFVLPARIRKVRGKSKPSQSRK